MMRHRNPLPMYLMAAFALCGWFALQVQAQDPFGEAAPAVAVPATAPQPAADAQDVAVAAELDPVVRGIMETNPTSPMELMWAVELTMNIGRVDQVQKFMSALVAAEPDASQLMAIERKWGSTLFFRLSHQSRYGRQVRAQALELLTATQRALHNPERLQNLVAGLAHPSAALRQAAANDLKQVGTSAVPALLAVLGDADSAESHALARDALVGLGSIAVDPLTGALQCPDPAIRWQVAEVLGRLEDSRVVDYLLGMLFEAEGDSRVKKAVAQTVQRLVGALPSRQEAEQFLVRKVRGYLSGVSVKPADLEGRVAVWEWNESAATVVSVRQPARLASMLKARKLAADLHQLDSENIDFRRLFLVAVLETEKRLVGLDEPLDRKSVDSQQVAALGAEALQDGLLFAVREKYLAAATAAAELLGDQGDIALLRGVDGRMQPLVQHLRHPNLRLRMACLDAILKLSTQQSYPGCSYVTETLGFITGSHGSPRVLVGDPRSSRAQSIGGLLNRLGYESDTANSGRELLRMARSNPDYEFILVSDAVQHPDLRELVQILRRDPRTSRLLVGILARTERMDRAQRIAVLDDRTLAFSLGALDVRMPSYELTLTVRGVDEPGFEEMLNVIRRDPRHDGLILRVATGGAALADARVFADADLRVEAQAGGPPSIVDGVYYDLSLVGDGADVPTLSQLVTFLRAESETKNRPIEILAQGPALIEAQRIARTESAITVEVRQTNQARISQLVEQILVRFADTQVPFSSRLRYSAQALAWLEKLSADRTTYGFYDLARTEAAVTRALNTPSLSQSSARVLGNLGTPQGQLALVDLASEHNRPLAQRQAAAAAFSVAVKRRGVLLTTRNVDRQYDRYNQSARLDKATQQLLGSILDAMEQSSRTVQESSGS